MGGDNGLLPFICRLDSLKSTPPAWAGTDYKALDTGRGGA